MASSTKNGEASIPATLLRERLPAALAAAEQREKTVYGETDPLEIQRVLDSFRKFVQLRERKESRKRRTVPHHRELLAQRQTRPVKRSGSAGPTHPSKRLQCHHGALRFCCSSTAISSPAITRGLFFVRLVLIYVSLPHPRITSINATKGGVFL